MSYDEKCGELARHFLTDAAKDDPRLPDAVEELAQAIQDSIEEFLRFRLCDQCSRIMTGKESIYSTCSRCRNERAVPG